MVKIPTLSQRYLTAAVRNQKMVTESVGSIVSVNTFWQSFNWILVEWIAQIKRTKNLSLSIDFRAISGMGRLFDGVDRFR